uniref:Uncharacterized protein n=1 Tax=Romanomermis culicivorax TaxID=13658 RepID=A0A915K4L2_ROMCU
MATVAALPAPLAHFAARGPRPGIPTDSVLEVIGQLESMNLITRMSFFEGPPCPSWNIQSQSILDHWWKEENEQRPKLLNKDLRGHLTLATSYITNHTD